MMICHSLRIESSWGPPPPHSDVQEDEYDWPDDESVRPDIAQFNFYESPNSSGITTSRVAPGPSPNEPDNLSTYKFPFFQSLSSENVRPSPMMPAVPSDIHSYYYIRPLLPFFVCPRAHPRPLLPLFVIRSYQSPQPWCKHPWLLNSLNACNALDFRQSISKWCSLSLSVRQHPCLWFNHRLHVFRPSTRLFSNDRYAAAP